jgi:hypothetical protein
MGVFSLLLPPAGVPESLLAPPARTARSASPRDHRRVGGMAIVSVCIIVAGLKLLLPLRVERPCPQESRNVE